MGGKCSPSGGIKKVFGGTRINNKHEDEPRSGKPNSRTDLYPDEEHQSTEDKITSRWYDGDGWAIWDRDYTNHGWSDAHPDVPHDHWFFWKRKMQVPSRSTDSVKPSPNFCG